MAYRNKDKIIQGGARGEIGVQSESYSLFFWSLNRDRLEVEKIHYPSSRIADRPETWYNTVSTKYNISRSLKLQPCSISLLIPATAVANALVLEKVMGNSLVPAQDFDCQVWKSFFPFTLQTFFPRTFLFDFFPWIPHGFSAYSILLSPPPAQFHPWTAPVCLFQMEFWLIWDWAALAICCLQKRDETLYHKWSLLWCPWRNHEGSDKQSLLRLALQVSPLHLDTSWFQYFCKMSTSNN